MTAWSPEPQSRLTVWPATSIGSPARSAAMRPTLRLSSPAWLAAPRMTSSITAWSMPVRSTSAEITCAARSSGRTSFSAPPYRPNGVRRPSTTTGVRDGSRDIGTDASASCRRPYHRRAPGVACVANGSEPTHPTEEVPNAPDPCGFRGFGRSRFRDPRPGRSRLLSGLSTSCRSTTRSTASTNGSTPRRNSPRSRRWSRPRTRTAMACCAASSSTNQGRDKQWIGPEDGDISDYVVTQLIRQQGEGTRIVARVVDHGGRRHRATTAP